MGEVLAELHASDEALFAAAEEKLLSAYEISSEKPAEKKLIYARVTRDEVERFWPVFSSHEMELEKAKELLYNSHIKKAFL